MTSAPVPPFWPQTVRLFCPVRWMPFGAASVAPSQRMRFAFPLTSMRFGLLVLEVTAYQPVPIVVVSPVMAVQDAEPMPAPCSST